MAQRIQVQTPAGVREYAAYADSREMAAEYAAGTLADGAEIVYRGMICDVLGSFTDADGERQVQLLVKGTLGPVCGFGANN